MNMLRPLGQHTIAGGIAGLAFPCRQIMEKKYVTYEPRCGILPSLLTLCYSGESARGRRTECYEAGVI